jgi:hypothetical protein
MPANLLQLRRARCILIVAKAPPGLAPADANRIFNEFVGSRTLPPAIFHDHFLGQAGGVAIVFAESDAERKALVTDTLLANWSVELLPLVFSHSPAAFDEQIAFTLKAYRGVDWEELQREHRPRYGSASREAETAAEATDDD